MAGSDLRRSNLDLLKASAPDLYEAVAAASPVSSDPIENPGFVARVSIDLPKPDGREPYLTAFIERVIAKVRADDIPFFSEPAFTLSCCLAVLGNPSTDAMFDLITRTRCIYLFIVVDDPARLAGQLDTTDWPAIAEKVRRQGGEIFFVAGGTADDVGGSICSTLASTAPAALDGLALAAFGQEDLAKSLAQTMGQLGFRALATLGTFYDECLMLRNSERNLRLPNAYLYRNDTALKPDMAALVVGSGPSLDQDIGFLQDHQETAVIISCGSALSALLAAGIRPDFHIELENINVMPTLGPAADGHDISDIPLIAPASVDPEAAQHFDRKIFSFRANLCNQPLYNLDQRSQPVLAEPTVVNLAAAFARERNFGEICFFGVDMGTRAVDGGTDHAQGTWHTASDTDYAGATYDIPVPANFGGTSYTSNGLYQALHSLSLLVSKDGSGRHYFNYSDGAAISGAKPLRTAEMRPTAPKRPKAELVAEILGEFAPWEAARLPDPWPGPEMYAVIEQKAEAVRGLLNGITDFSDKSYIPTIGQLFNYGEGHFAAAPPGPESAATILVRGSIGSWMLFMEHFLNRVTSPGDLARVGTCCVEMINFALDDLLADAKDRVGGDGVRNVPEFEDIRLAPDAAFPALPSVPRNAPCPCGSGKRYKQCHGQTALTD